MYRVRAGAKEVLVSEFGRRGEVKGVVNPEKGYTEDEILSLKTNKNLPINSNPTSPDS